MATTETLTTGRVVGTSVPRKRRTASSSPATASSSTTSTCPDRSGWLSSAALRARADRQGRPRRGAQGAGASSPRSAAPSSPPTGPARCRARGRSPRRSGCRRTSRSPSTRRVTGDGVAVVVAETRSLAKDAAELVEVEYEPLGAVTDVAKALGRRRAARPRRPWDERVLRLEARGEVDRAFADADVTVARLPPAAADPGGDGAARRRSRRSCPAPTS